MDENRHSPKRRPIDWRPACAALDGSTGGRGVHGVRDAISRLEQAPQPPAPA